MSGHKRATITISEEEYQRLQDIEVQMRAKPLVEAYPTSVSNELVQQTQTAIDQNLAWMQARQAQFDKAMAAQHSEVQRVEKAAHQAMAAQQNQLMHQIQAVAGSLWANTDALLQDVQQQYQHQLQVVEQRVCQEIAVVNQRLDQRAQQDDNRQSAADEWLTAARNYYRLIENEYRHDFFFPGELNHLASQMDLAAQNANSGLPEASIAAAQQLYLNLTDLRVRLEQAETEWILLNQACVEAVQTVYEELDQCQEIEAIDMDGNPLPYQLEVDYWTQGAWSALADRFLETIQALRCTDPQPSFDFLQGLLYEYLPSARAQLADVCFSARVGALNAQLRANIADLVVQALSEQGFQMADYQYTQDDWRAPFEAHLTSPDHSQVTVQVNPFGNNLGENELHIISEDQIFQTQRELRQRWVEVQESLVGAGLLVNDLQVVRTPAITQRTQQQQAHKRIIENNR